LNAEAVSLPRFLQPNQPKQPSLDKISRL
jgi:hypothetical protein